MSGIATAVIGSSVGSGLLSASAADKAGDAQVAASRSTLEEQARQFDEMKELMKPYIDIGTDSLGAQADLLGIGDGSQQEAIDQFSQSPLFQSLTQQGEDAILQNAAATGGLRGGNTQGALAQFRPAMLNQILQQQFSNLGNLTAYGQASAAGQGAAGQNYANAVGNINSQIGDAQAQEIAGRTQAYGGILNGLTKAFGQTGGF